MRKFIVRNFALGYYVKMFGKVWGAPRASRIIFPLMVITGVLNLYNESYPTPNLYVTVSLVLTALALFFGFFYFRWFPVRYSELDFSQKIQFGQLKPDELSAEEFVEWVYLSETHNE